MKFFEEAVLLVVQLVSNKRVYVCTVDAVEYVFLNVAVSLVSETADQRLGLASLGCGLVHSRAFRHFACATQKFKAVVSRPRDNAVLVYSVKGTDKLHSLEIRALQLGKHCLYLGAPQHSHQRGLDHVGKMVSEGDLVAAETLRKAVKVSASHPRAKIAGRRAAVPLGNAENVRLEEFHGYLETRGVLLDAFSPPNSLR